MSHMLREIEQQPEVLQKTFERAVGPIEKFKKKMQKRPPRLIVLVARGTSDNAALFGAVPARDDDRYPGFARRAVGDDRSTKRRSTCKGPW